MDELQEYLFENKEQFKEVHYLDLMNLCLKLHKKINEPVNNRSLFSEPFNNDLLFNYTSLINISNEQWNESFLEDQSTFLQFIRRIIRLDNQENVCDMKITFPSILSTFQRQKIHIYINMEAYIDTPCTTKSITDASGDRKLSIYLSMNFISNLNN
jgi:hypothetical protein